MIVFLYNSIPSIYNFKYGWIMKLAMIKHKGAQMPAVKIINDKYLTLEKGGWTNIQQIMESGTEGLSSINDIFEDSEGDVVVGPEICCPIARPEKIMCIGQNYADHCRELGNDLPKAPILFAKFANALTGDNAEIPLPQESKAVDYEAELAVIIGRKCRQVEASIALDYVFGYSCANDLTMRDIQQQEPQWVRAKTPDSFCPLGPVIVTRDEIADPQKLSIRMRLNGRIMQDSSTREMVFSVAELISRLSQSMTLVPGDIILTGTPPGVGAGRNPQVFLKPGDRLEVEIESVGTLVSNII